MFVLVYTSVYTLRVFVVYIGDFSYEMGSSGWTDTSIGSQAWELEKYNDTFVQGKNNQKKIRF